MPAQGWHNPGHRDEMNPQPQWGCAEIEFPREPRVARTRNPGLRFAIPTGLGKSGPGLFWTFRQNFPNLPHAMPQSLSAIYIHLTFSTKERRPWLRDKPVRDKLHAQMGGISKTLGCPPLIIGGVEDHVHLLCRFGRTITQAEWVKELKRVSNGWLKEQGSDYADFAWQGGYADFSVSQSNLPQVKRYIADQETHHQKRTFQNELRTLLQKHGVEFDERYVWD